MSCPFESGQELVMMLAPSEMHILERVLIYLSSENGSALFFPRTTYIEFRAGSSRVLCNRFSPLVTTIKRNVVGFVLLFLKGLYWVWLTHL